MYALNASEYRQWVAIPQPSLRFWIRAWLDGLHCGTHVHWAISPLSLLALAHLWRFLDTLGGYFDAHLKTSLKLLARSRIEEPAIEGSVPDLLADDRAWVRFFEDQITFTESIRPRILDAARAAVVADLDARHLLIVMSSLWGMLSLEQYTTDHVFRNISNWVLIPPAGDHKDPLGRFHDLIDRWQSPTTDRFVAWTEMRRLADLSNTLKRRWSRRSFATVDDCDFTGTDAVLVGSGGGEPFIVSRLDSSRGVPELHRRQALRVAAQRFGADPALEAHLSFPQRSFFRAAGRSQAAAAYHDTSFRKLGVKIEPGPARTGSVQYRDATAILYDRPEQAIHRILHASDQDFGERPNATLASAYRWSLRHAVSSDVADWLARSLSIAGKLGVQAPGTLKAIINHPELMREGFAFGPLLEASVRDSVQRDVSLELRLREILDDSWGIRRAHRGLTHTCASAPTCTFWGIRAMLELARGVRNWAQHHAGDDPPMRLYGVLLYLARVTAWSYAAARNRDSYPSRLVAGNVRRLRAQAGLTRTQLAEMASVAEEYLRRIERAEVDVDASSLQGIADALNVGLDSLVGEEHVVSAPS